MLWTLWPLLLYQNFVHAWAFCRRIASSCVHKHHMIWIGVSLPHSCSSKWWAMCPFDVQHLLLCTQSSIKNIISIILNFINWKQSWLQSIYALLGLLKLFPASSNCPLGMSDVEDEKDDMTFQKALLSGGLQGLPTYRLPFHPKWVPVPGLCTPVRCQFLMMTEPMVDLRSIL